METICCQWCKRVKLLINCDTLDETKSELVSHGWQRDDSGIWLCPECVVEVRKLNKEGSKNNAIA